METEYKKLLLQGGAIHLAGEVKAPAGVQTIVDVEGLAFLSARKPFADDPAQFITSEPRLATKGVDKAGESVARMVLKDIFSRARKVRGWGCRVPIVQRRQEVAQRLALGIAFRFPAMPGLVNDRDPAPLPVMDIVPAAAAGGNPGREQSADVIFKAGGVAERVG